MNALLRLASTLDEFEFYSESDQIYNLIENLSKVIVSENKDSLIKTAAEILGPDGRPYKAPPRPQVPRPTNFPSSAGAAFRPLGAPSFIDAFLSNGNLDPKKVQNFITNSQKAVPDDLYRLYLQGEKNPTYQKLTQKFDTAYRELDELLNDRRISPKTRRLIQNAQSQLVASKRIVLNKFIVKNPNLFTPQLVQKAVKFFNTAADAADAVPPPRSPSVPTGGVPKAPNAPSMAAIAEGQEEFTRFARTSSGRKMIDAIRSWISKNSGPIISRINSFPKPVQVVLKKIPYAFLALQGGRILNSLIRGQEVPATEYASFCAAIISIPQVAAIAGPLAPSLIIAGNVANLGGIDLANFAGDPAAGFSLWGFQITKQSKERSNVNRNLVNADLKTFDVQVQGAYQMGQNIVKRNPRLNTLQIRQEISKVYEWAENPNDYRFAQLNALLGRLKKQSRQDVQVQNQAEINRTINQTRQDINQRQQAKQTPKPMMTPRDLMAQAYLEVTNQNLSDVESLFYNKEFVVEKIKEKASQYPTIWRQALKEIDKYFSKWIPVWEKRNNDRFYKDRPYLPYHGGNIPDFDGEVAPIPDGAA